MFFFFLKQYITFFFFLKCQTVYYFTKNISKVNGSITIYTPSKHLYEVQEEEKLIELYELMNQEQ